MGERSLHIAMYPWYAMSHLTSFLHISNKLADRGHKISFFLPTNTQSKLQQFNLHPELITFIPITLPHVDGLPSGAETTADVPFALFPLLATAMDLTRPTIESFLQQLKPNFVFFDFTCWLPSYARGMGIKSIMYCVVGPITVGHVHGLKNKILEKKLKGADLMEPPPGFFPNSSVKLPAYEAHRLARGILRDFGSGITFGERMSFSFTECDAICFRTCREMEGSYCDFIENKLKKTVFLAGPVVPEPPNSTMEEKWASWLNRFEAKTLIFCALGSECVMAKDQFQELILGLELSGLPFLAVLKPPMGAETIESALPEGFEERTQGRGVVYGGWVQQQLILGHPCVGCFVTHCGSASLAEAMVKECQLVLLPHIGDQVFQSILMGGVLKVGAEVERGEEDGLFTKDGVCKAIKSVMEVDSEVGKEVRANHTKWREFLLSKGLESRYIDGFVQNLQGLLV